jgi:hypothetical protein
MTINEGDHVKHFKLLFWFYLIFLCIASPAAAHVPFIENEDYAVEHPFVVKDSIENSKAVYAWLQTGTDIDVYVFDVTKPVRVYAQALVQVCPEYEQFLPWLAIAGPGLPLPEEELPFVLPDDYGAVIVKNKNPGEPRPAFHEFVSGKDYFDAPAFDRAVSTKGIWYIFFYDSYEKGGDYVGVLGFKEVFSLPDLVRTLIITPTIWINAELHTTCR